MQLGTFGAILRFAMELESQAAAFYEAAAQGDLADSFQEMARISRKRLNRLQRARQEGVAEMILESIEGLDSSSYQVELTADADTGQRLQQAVALEETTSLFYRDAAAKMPIQEIVRLFHRLADENMQRQGELAGLQAS